MKKYSIILLGVFMISFLALVSCKEEKVYIPKPRVYPKVEYPQRNYVQFDKDICDFYFEHPDYMVFEQDTKFIYLQAPHACWFNLQMPSLNGDVHFTYTPLGPKDSLEQQLHKVYNDAYRMAEDHVSKSNGIEDLLINNPNNHVYGVLFNLEGSVASPFQIVLTDSMHHAVRASLYFKTRPDADSMAPVINFVKTDITGILNSFKWRE
jgi:gliding motility-associated lipoprotein GldD